MSGEKALRRVGLEQTAACPTQAGTLLLRLSFLLPL